MGTLVKLKAPSCSVWFGNLNSKVTDKHLLELGTQAGPVTRASRSKDASYGFVEYADVESAIYCVGMYNGVLKLFGQPVSVDFSNRAVPDLKPEEQALLDRCLKLINAAHYINGNAGVVRRGGREAQRYTPYGDARGHREQRAAMRAPTRFNDDHTDAAYGATDAAAGYDKSAEAGQAYSWPAAAAAPAAPPVQLDSNALAAMQAAAVAAAAATGLGGRPAAQQPPQQPQQHVQVQVQPSAWPGAVPAASAPAFVQLPHAAPGAQAVVIVQQQPQQPPQQPHATYQQAHVYQQSQQHQQMVQHVPAAAPQYHQQQPQPYQAVQQVNPATAAYQQQWQHHQQQQQQQYYQQQQGQYAVQQQQVQYAQPAAAPANGGFQSSMPGAVQGQYQYQAAGAGQYAQPQQQQGTWYYQ